MAETTTASVNILDKDYEVACAPGEVEALKASARYVDRQMQAIKQSGKVIGLDRVAVMAALNIANDYLGAENQRKLSEKRIDALAEKLGLSLQQQQPGTGPITGNS